MLGKYYGECTHCLGDGNLLPVEGVPGAHARIVFHLCYRCRTGAGARYDPGDRWWMPWDHYKHRAHVWQHPELWPRREGRLRR